jgi:predicted RNA-binding protein with PUA-like domain
MKNTANYWLLKTEPNTFSIDDLAKLPKQTSPWDGVRNYQARNMLRDDIQKGNLAFFYHSSCAVPGVAGVVEVVRGGYPDAAAWDPESPYYDPKSTPENPIWYRVDVRLIKVFSHIVTLQQLRQTPQLEEMVLLRKGNRLSVMPVTKNQFEQILKLSEKN